MDAPPISSTHQGIQWSQPSVARKTEQPSAASESFAEAMGGKHVQPASLISQSRPRTLRFAPLSALPQGKGLPARRDVVGPSEVSTPSGISPRQLPGIPHPSVQRPSLPTILPAKEARKLGFNCPSCMTILIIKQPESYNGQPGPCPHCGVIILPPRIATPSPFTLVASGAHPQERPALPGGGAPARIPVGRPAPVALPAAARKPGLPGAKSFARAAMF